MSGMVSTELSGCAEKLIRGRHATRAFRPEAVPEETMRAIFFAGWRRAVQFQYAAVAGGGGERRGA